MLEAEQIMKRCQIGTRNYEEANNLHAECYRVIGKLLAERTEQEPVAWIEHHKGGDNLEWDNPGGKCTPLYTATPAQPPQRKPLTEEQIESLAIDVLGYGALREQDLELFTQSVRKVEAAHDIKENT